jgi:hypothetical protein
MKRTAFFTTLCLVAVIAAITNLPSAHAATNPAGPGQALEIAPPVLNLRGDAGQAVRGTINLRDVSPTALIVTNQINDFTAQGEEGIPKLLLDEGESSPYSMRSWFRTIGQITLKPRQIQALPFTIDIPKKAAPGGYYAVVRFSGSAPGIDSSGVSLSASIGALIFLRVNGDAQEKLSIASFNTVSTQNKPKTLFESTPVTFSVRVKNEGNVHEQPAGRIMITDMFGKTVAGVNVNLPPRNVLPGSIRRFDTPLDKTVIGNKMLFGRYTAKLDLTYGTDKTTLTKTTSFWVVPVSLIIGIIAVLIALFFGLRFMIKRYNRAVIKKAQKRARRRR